VTTRGRPRHISREILEEAASELFLEQGYSATSVDDIAQRAGVSRATFFNYFPTKADVLFTDIDRAIDEVDRLVGSGLPALEALTQVAQTVTRADLPLLVTQAEAMDVSAEVTRAGLERFDRIRRLLANHYPQPMTHWVLAAAVTSAAISWAMKPQSATAAHPPTLARALADAANSTGASRQPTSGDMH
jgi:AcrR family transcriptional regulator